MTKTVLLFAAAKELAGAETVELQLDDNGASVGAAKEIGLIPPVSGG